MPDAGGQRRSVKRAHFGTAAVIVLVLIIASCRRGEREARAPSSAVLRVGISQLSSTNPIQGLRQLTQILAAEGLGRTGEDGRMQSALAERWVLRDDHRSIEVKLRPNVKFHDGTPVDAQTVAAIIPAALRSMFGSVFSDVDHIRATAPDTIEIAFRESSPFLTDTLEVPIQKEGGASTGPFAPVQGSKSELRANREYYLGPPALGGLHVETYPSVRSAWADLLRNRIDMLYEVGPDALASIEKSNSIAVFTLTRRYQYVIALNPETPSLKSAAIRRALNGSIDRKALIQNALNSYGVASSGPVWPRHWAFHRDLAQRELDTNGAAALLGRTHVKFTCLVPPDASFERIALEVKRQLATVGVEMVPEEVSYDDQAQRGAKRQYEALLTELISGPTLVRPYVIWHSEGPFNWAHVGNASIDRALDRVRHAGSDDEVRDAVGDLQRASLDDPPAIFLAWSVRARAVSKRFAVQTEEGRDILGTMRLWKPTTADAQVTRN